MGNDSRSQERLFLAAYRLLRPLARIFVKAGLGYREFSEAAKHAMLDAVDDEYGSDTKTTSISRCQVLTGMTRKEISKARNLTPDKVLGRVQAPAPIMHLIKEWHKNGSFSTASGKPRKLRIRGGKHSFEALVQVIGRDIGSASMLAELLDRGIVRQSGDGLSVEFDGVLSPSEQEGLEDVVDMLFHVSPYFDSACTSKIGRENWAFMLNSDIVEVRPEDASRWEPVMDRVADSPAGGISQYASAYRDLFGVDGAQATAPPCFKYAYGNFACRLE